MLLIKTNNYIQKQCLIMSVECTSSHSMSRKVSSCCTRSKHVLHAPACICSAGISVKFIFSYFPVPSGQLTGQSAYPSQHPHPLHTGGVVESPAQQSPGQRVVEPAPPKTKPPPPEINQTSTDNLLDLLRYIHFDKREIN